MNHRAFFCLAVSTCLLACAVKTTSLGGPQGNQSSASSADGGDGKDAGAPVPGVDASGSAMCSWYSWGPSPTTVDCECNLPSGPSPNGPVFDAKSWSPQDIRIEVSPTKDIGQYAGSSDGCGTDDGWYYVDAGAGQTPTLFMVCPKSCATAATDGGFIALAAFWCLSR